MAAVQISMQERITQSQGTRYLNANLFQLHQHVSSGLIDINWIETANQDADMGTKALQGHQFHVLSDRQFSRKPDNNSNNNNSKTNNNNDEVSEI